ncbi:MAG TPA: hypothetical protein VF406_17725 [Thermodesulfobacteriota bacterium]
MPMIVLIPRATPKAERAPAVAFVPRPAALGGLRVGFLDNTKPNSDLYLRTVADALDRRVGLAARIHRRKRDSSSPAAPELIAEMAKEADVVVNAVPD